LAPGRPSGPEDATAGWPKSGEIDIMEHVGFDPKKLHFTVHTEKYNHVKQTHKGTAVTRQTADTDFHVYALEWLDDRLDFYLDGDKVFTFKNNGEGHAAWPFDAPFYLNLNLAWGGTWGGKKGVDESKLPQTFLIDYVRVWQ
jgi:beta-glucanase (GH16 family)